MTEKERLETMIHSCSVLKGMVKELELRIGYAQDGIKEKNRNLIMGSLYGLDDIAERIKLVFGFMRIIHMRDFQNDAN